MDEDNIETLRYNVYATNKDGEEKVIAGTVYKQDAIKIANRFLNAEVIRSSNRGEEKTVYIHYNDVKDEHGHLFTKAGLKKAKAN